MQNILTTGPHGNSAPRYQRAPILQKPDASRALKALEDWRIYSQPGDYAQAILLGPAPISRAHYGQPIDPESLAYIERLLSGGDIAIVQGFFRPIVLLPIENFEALAEAA